MKEAFLILRLIKDFRSSNFLQMQFGRSRIHPVGLSDDFQKPRSASSPPPVVESAARTPLLPHFPAAQSARVRQGQARERGSLTGGSWTQALPTTGQRRKDAALGAWVRPAHVRCRFLTRGSGGTAGCGCEQRPRPLTPPWRPQSPRSLPLPQTCEAVP